MTIQTMLGRACAAGLLCLCAAQAGAGLFDAKGKSAPAVVLEPGADLAAKAPELTVVEGDRKIAGAKKYALTGFNVEFQVMARDSDIQFGNTVGADAKLTMSGVSNEDMQRITDRAYSNFVEQMKAQGIELVLPADLAGRATWDAIVKDGKGPAYEMTGESEKVRFVAPTGQTVIVPKPDEHTARLAWGLSGFAGMAQAMLPQKEIALAKELGVPAMKVSLVVRFGSAKAQTGAYATQARAAVAGMILGEGQSAISIRTPKASALPAMSTRKGGSTDGDAFVRLKTSVTAPVDFLAGPVAKANSLDKKGGNVLVGLLGAGTTKNDFVAPVDPAKYEEFAVGALSNVTGLFAARLKSAAEVAP